MIHWCGSITIWRWCGPHSSSWWTARWTTAERICSTLFARMGNGSSPASRIPGGRIVRLNRTHSRFLIPVLFTIAWRFAVVGDRFWGRVLRGCDAPTGLIIFLTPTHTSGFALLASVWANLFRASGARDFGLHRASISERTARMILIKKNECQFPILAITAILAIALIGKIPGRKITDSL